MTIIINGYELPELDFTRVEVRFHARTEDDVKAALAVMARIPGAGEPRLTQHGAVVFATTSAPDVESITVFIPRPAPVELSGITPEFEAAQALLDEAAIERTTEASIEGIREALAGKGSL